MNPFLFLELCVSSMDISSHAPRHHVVDNNGDLLPRSRSSSSVSWDQMIQSSRHLLILILILNKAVKCWSWVHSFSPSGDSVPSGPAPLSHVICLFSFRLTYPRRALVIFFVYAVNPHVWTVHSGMPWLSAIAEISGFTLALPFAHAFVSSASFVPVTVPVGFAALRALLASSLSSVTSSFSTVFPCLLCTLSKRLHTHRHMTCRYSCPNRSVSSSRTPVRNSRWMSFGTISLTANVFCASSIALN